MKYIIHGSDECKKYKHCNVCPMCKLIKERYKTDFMLDVIDSLKLKLIDESPCKTVVQHMIKEDKKAALDVWKAL